MPDPSHEVFVISVTTTAETARRAADALWEVLDSETSTVSVFESASGEWRIAVHTAEPEFIETIRGLLAQFAGADPESVAVDSAEAKDWVAASLAGLSPVLAGRFFVHGAHDRARAPVNALAIELEAALAFGTGHHGTTRGCLLALDRLLKARQPRRILDIGTGTAILAIAAAKAARKPVLASDIDRQAVRVARGNAAANAVGNLVEIIAANGLRGPRFSQRGPFDLVFANILLGPLQRLAVPIARVAARDGLVVLSGLLNAQANACLHAYRMQGFRLHRRIQLEGWTTLILART